MLINCSQFSGFGSFVYLHFTSCGEASCYVTVSMRQRQSLRNLIRSASSKIGSSSFQCPFNFHFGLFVSTAVGETYRPIGPIAV
jgi:hypothetical protein